MTFVPTHEQQEIITYPKRHVRVAAGAGTGKTTTIVERLRAFVEGGTSPTKALGITFTVKAADELRNRLRDRLTSTMDSEEVEVSTYHGFATSILDEFGALVGYEPSSLLLDDGHRSELGQLVLRTTPTNLDLTAMNARIGDLLDLSDALDRHLLSPQQLIEDAPAHGDDQIMETWAKRIDLAAVAAAYRSEKERLGLIEFSDLITKAVKLVTAYPEIGEELATRYDVVLLDEYQDTDPAQRILLTAIFGPSAAVTAVGDSDQTIYEWRGASLDNFDAFPEHFPRSDGEPTETLPLSLNRRSDRLIIDLANTIKAELPSLEGSEPLVPRPEAAEGSLAVAWLRSEREEARWIAEDILRRHGAGLRYGDIAILVRKRAWIPLLVAALREFDIPTSVSDPGTLLQVPEVADVLAWLRIVSDPDAEPALLRILMGGQYRLGMADLNALKVYADSIEADSIMAAVMEASRVDGLSQATASDLARFAQTHEGLMRYAQANTVANTINQIITTIGFWDEAAALRPGEATTARLNIARFLNLANGWRPIEGRPTVSRFLRYIDALNESGRDEALTPPTASVAEAVELTTVHGAKGLEWGTVYLPGLQADGFPMSARRHDDPDRHAMLLPYELRLDAEHLSDLAATSGDRRKEHLTERNTQSEHRLAYVAVTRAKHTITMSGHVWQDHLKRPKKPSPYLLMARDLPGTTIGPWVEEPGDPPTIAVFSDAAVVPDPVFDHDVGAAFRRIIADPSTITTDYPELADAVTSRTHQLKLEIGDLSEPTADPVSQPFSTAVTNLVALAQCPLKFKWIHHDKLPRRPSKAALRGTEFHRKVELHNLGVISLDDAAPTSYDAVETDGGFDDEGEWTASDPWSVFESSRFAHMRARFTEAPFEFAIGSGSIRGKIDAIYEPSPGFWEIVDYKSGRPSTDPSRMVQLKAYALAAAEGVVSSETPDAMSVSFAYFGGSEAEEVSETVDDRWIAEAKIEIAGLVAVGAEGPWNATPSPACRFCDFLVHCDAGKSFVKSQKSAEISYRSH
ncbi:MAG: ATP-dependent helicase [Acidimicrobiia bacterium]|nr:ATP-dependent helicase [Acidimicrobiia bacterium]